MFDTTAEGLGRLTGPQLAAAVEANHRDLLAVENRVLLLAAAWADLHDVEPGEQNSPLVAKSRIVGGDGTPAVSAPRPCRSSPPPSSAPCKGSGWPRRGA